jgi:prolyl oligopeptidase
MGGDLEALSETLLRAPAWAGSSGGVDRQPPEFCSARRRMPTTATTTTTTKTAAGVTITTTTTTTTTATADTQAEAPPLPPPSGASALDAPPPADDPHFWLEDVLGEKALKRVEELNAACLEAVGDPKESPAYSRIKEILDSKDKIPHAFRIGTDPSAPYYNFWQVMRPTCAGCCTRMLPSLRSALPPALSYCTYVLQDEEHVQGIWRRTSLDSFTSAEETEWTTVLDLDALPPPETGTAKTWVWHGSTLLDEGPSRSNWDRALISLSPGGSDADTCREFDLTTSEFVDPAGLEMGFAMPDPAKTNISYRSRNECIVGTDFGGDGSSLTDSGYPRVVKSWKRGTPIEDAVTIFEAEQTDIAAHQYAYHDRGHVHEFQLRSITFYTSAYTYRSLTDEGINGTTADVEAAEFKPVPIPEDAELSTFADMALVTLRSDLEGKAAADDATTYPAGSMLSLPLRDLIEDDWSGATALFVPTKTKSLSSTTQTKDYIIIKVLEDVRTGLEFWKFDAAARTWSKEEVEGDAAVPVGQDVSVASPCRDCAADNDLWLFRDGYLVPDALERASAEDGCASTVQIQSKPSMFNADGLTVEQRFATSADGTKIPYFVIMKEGLPLDGSSAVLLDAYGGFEISMLPGYSAGVGAGWLERGGVKVIANIRGGGEYGPTWHQAALKAHRKKCYEDMEAVGQALIDSGLTSPAKLACIGGSNGGE